MNNEFIIEKLTELEKYYNLMFKKHISREKIEYNLLIFVLSILKTKYKDTSPILEDILKEYEYNCFHDYLVRNYNFPNNYIEQYYMFFKIIYLFIEKTFNKINKETNHKFNYKFLKVTKEIIYNNPKYNYYINNEKIFFQKHNVWYSFLNTSFLEYKKEVLNYIN